MDTKQCMIVDLERRGNKRMFITEQVASINENKNGLWTVRFLSSSRVFNYNHSRLLYLTHPETIDINEKGLYVNMPATQDKGGNWKDVCWPVTAEFRKQLNDALIDGYGQAIENLQATLEATKGAAEKPSLTGALKENAGKVKEQPTKPAPSKNEQAR